MLFAYVDMEKISIDFNLPVDDRAGVSWPMDVEQTEFSTGERNPEEHVQPQVPGIQSRNQAICR